MDVGACIQKIDRYLAKDNVQPLIVDIQNRQDLASLVTHYTVGKNRFIAASEYCKNDEMPLREMMLDVLSRSAGNLFVIGLSSFLKLEGERVVRTMLKEILNMTVSGHVVIFSYQCRQYLKFSDSRLSTRICEVDGDVDSVPVLVFSAVGLPLPQGATVKKGIHSIAEAIENTNADKIYIETAKQKSMFPFSILTLIDFSKAYEALLQRDQATRDIPEKCGTSEQWNYALSKFAGNKSWADIIDSEFGNRNALDLVIPSFSTFDENRKWLFFIGLLLYGAKNNWCLNEAAKKAVSLEDLSMQIYRCILDVPHTSEHFEMYYGQRKALLNRFGNPLDEVVDFCKIVLGKGKDAIYYLTDNTQKEKELIFFLLDKYGDEYSREEVLSVLKLVYPALYAYLSPYRFKINLLDRYFQEYKYQKVLNRIFPKFEEVVTEQAEKREYNLLLEPRASKIEAIDRTGAQLFFVDAMGVEYLGYIMALCQKFKLMANVTVCSCELPSITSKNKEFLTLFEGGKYQTVSIKELDEIKHHGKYDFDYQKTKLPIHLSKELEVLRELLQRIKERLANGTIDRAILIADHGASRLAVIHETETLWEMSSKGEHSGRCCLKSEVDEQPAFATDAGDFWALANYDRFKGGRRACVEVHGGATLEEVAVPIIELTYLANAIEVHLLPISAVSVDFSKPPEIEVSFRKKAAIKIFFTQKLQNVSICIEGRYYDAVPLDDNFYAVEMADIKREKTYSVDVYANNNLVAEGLPLIVKKEGSSERDLL